MIEKPGLLNKYYSLFLILMGLLGFFWRYLTDSDFQFTALIPAVFGLILLPMSGPIARENHILAHIVVSLTLLFGLISFYMFAASISGDEVSVRRLFLFGLMFISSVITMVMYILRFIKIRKRKNLAVSD